MVYNVLLGPLFLQNDGSCCLMEKTGDGHLLPCTDGSREQNSVDEKVHSSTQLHRTVVPGYCIINHFLIIGALDIILMKLQGKLNALHCNNKGSTFITCV